MTTFEERFQNGLEGFHAESPGFDYTCSECQDAHGFCCEHSAKHALENGEVEDEGAFSWHGCDICGSQLGGHRYPAHALDKDNEIVHLEVCSDCYLYMANGELPEGEE
jgi:hypothetical protein